MIPEKYSAINWIFDGNIGEIGRIHVRHARESQWGNLRTVQISGGIDFVSFHIEFHKNVKLIGVIN